VNGDVTYGVEADPRDPWVAAAGSLTPDKSLGRIAANARFTVGTVTVVGTALTALGLVTVAAVSENTVARALALAAVVLATLAVVLALSYLTVRLERLNVSDLEQVRSWYLRQFRRTWLPASAGWLLVIAVVLSAGAGIGAALHQASTPEPQLSLSTTGIGRNSTLTAHAVVYDLDPGTDVIVEITAMSSVKGTRMRLFANHTRAGEDRKVSVEARLEDVPPLREYVLTLRASGRSASLTLPNS
jgi:hypothetical protein